MSPLPVENILILGGTGNIGSVILKAFVAHNTAKPASSFNITVLTRASSHTRTLSDLDALLGPSAATINLLAIDSYTDVATLTSLLEKHNIEVFLSCIASFSTNDQAALIDAAVFSGTVRRFIPSEYGVDTSSHELVAKHLPLAAVLKQENIDYLRRKSTETNGYLTWSAIITGTFFDWGLKVPFAVGWDLKGGIVHVMDGGNVKYEATNLDQIGRGVVACLATQDAYKTTRDRYVYINSFTTTMNEVIGVVEKYTGKTFERVPQDAKEISEKGRMIMNDQGGLDWYRAYVPTAEMPYPPGSVEQIHPCLYGGEVIGGLNQYSMREPGLDNDLLGLPKEDLQATVKTVLGELGLLKT